MKTFRIITLGCKVNQYESESLAQSFLANGYQPAREGERATVGVVNTCSVTNISDRKSRKLIRQTAKDCDLLAVCGCYAQAKPEEASKIDGVDLVIGNGNKHLLFSMMEDKLNEKELGKISIFPLTAETSFGPDSVTQYQEKTRAIIKVQDGCNSFCSYCIIPYVRGRLRSRNPLEILEEIKLLAANGYLEIVLAGIHVCHYGKDFSNTESVKDLVDLLKEIEKIDGIQRIRLSSIEPFAFTDKFFEFYKETKKLCPHFHISLQSGSDAVLLRMNRHYSGEYYQKTVEALRSIRPETTVTTDVIVGFPGETEEEFQETIALAQRVQFLKIHTFPYSRRSGTVADSMPNQLSTEVKTERSKKMLALSDRLEEQILSQFVGKTLSVLAEEEKNGGIFGFSENYLPVILENKTLSPHKIYSVTPYKTDGKFLYVK